MKKADKKKREWMVTAAVILAILFAAVSWNLYQEKKLAAAEAQLWREQAGTSQKEGKAGYGQVQNTIEYKGKTYRRNTYVKAILCMDRPEGTSDRDENSGSGGTVRRHLSGRPGHGQRPCAGSGHTKRHHDPHSPYRFERKYPGL